MKRDNNINKKYSKIMDISVVIPIYNAKRYLECCIEALFSQSYPKENYEIIIIDNCSTDDSAAGLPVVATDVGSVAEIVINGRSGFLVPAQNVIALVSKLEYLINHPEIWLQMGRYGRECVKKKYDIKKLNKRLVKIFNNLLDYNNMLLDKT